MCLRTTAQCRPNGLTAHQLAYFPSSCTKNLSAHLYHQHYAVLPLFAAAAVRPTIRIPPACGGVAPIATTIVSPACGGVAPATRVPPTCGRVAPAIRVLPTCGRVAPVSEATVSPGCHERHARIIRTGSASRTRNRLRKN